MPGSALEDVARHLAAIVESSDDAIISMDPSGVITSWNPAAHRMFGYAPADAIGRPISLVVPKEREPEQPELRARVLTGQPVRNFETERLRRDGVLIPVVVTLSPIRDATGQVVAIASIIRDV